MPATTLNRFASFAAATVTAAATLTTAPALAQSAPDVDAGTAPVATDGTREASLADRVRYGTEEIQGQEIFYREAGPEDAPAIVLLHGFPTSSHQYRDLIPRLSDTYRVIAPDYPGYGLSSAPPADEFDYTFDNLADITHELLERKGYDSYTLYVMDYGAPVGFRIMQRDPDAVEGLIVQNGNAYDEGLDNAFWAPIKEYWNNPRSRSKRDALRGLLTLEATVWQWHHGTRHPETVSPDNWLVVQPLLDREGNNDIQLDLFLDYGTNPARYPAWQETFREQQYPTLIVWGRNDQIFPADGAYPYLRDLPHAEFHLLDTGHFALEEDGELIAELIRRWMENTVKPAIDAE